MKNPERTVLIDMDGTIANLDSTVMQTLDEFWPDVPKPERNNFYIEDDLATEHKHLIREIISEPGFFAKFAVIEGALEGWGALLEHGYEPRICTAPLRKNSTCIQDKIQWLEEHFAPHFGTSVIDNAIVDKQKYRHAGLALIDDRPEIDSADKALWEHIVIDRPYNLDSRAQYRMRNWFDKSLFVALGSLANREV